MLSCLVAGLPYTVLAKLLHCICALALTRWNYMYKRGVRHVFPHSESQPAIKRKRIALELNLVADADDHRLRYPPLEEKEQHGLPHIQQVKFDLHKNACEKSLK